MANTRVGHLINKLIVGCPHQLEPLYIRCKSILDIGCSDGNTFNSTEFRRIENRYGLDPKHFDFPPNGNFIQGEYNEEHPYWNKEFDLITLLDVIEHVPKEESVKMLSQAEKMARKMIIVWTPDTFLPTDKSNVDKWDTHRCGWTAFEFLDRGYCVYRTGKTFHHNPHGNTGDWASILAWRKND